MWGGGAESQAPWGFGPDVLSFILGLICSGFVCVDLGGVQGWNGSPKQGSPT